MQSYLVVYALVKRDAERPPIGPHIITLSTVDLGRKIGQRSRLARHSSPRYDVRGNILSQMLVIPNKLVCRRDLTYKIRQMDMPIRV